MSEWQPIYTAPKDGTLLWVWNGQHYGIAEWYTTPPEPKMTYDYATAQRANMARPIPRTPEGDIDWERSRAEHIAPELIPNPNAGKTMSFWSTIWATYDYTNYDGNQEGAPEPTHWMPLPPSPTGSGGED